MPWESIKSGSDADSYSHWQEDIKLEALAHFFGYKTFDEDGQRAMESEDTVASALDCTLLEKLGFKQPSVSAVSVNTEGNHRRFMSGGQLEMQELRGTKKVVTNTLSEGLFAIHFVPNSPSHHVIAFRGTQGEASDMITDTQLSVGDSQFNDNRAAIRSLIDDAYTASGVGVIVTGHSLGGALAQQIAYDTVVTRTEPHKIHRVVTFQSPGLYKTKVWDNTSPPLQSCTHHISKFDIVDMAGDDHLLGQDDPSIFLHTCQGESGWVFNSSSTEGIMQAHRVGMLMGSPCSKFRTWKGPSGLNIEVDLVPLRADSPDDLVANEWVGYPGMEIQSFDQYDDYRTSRLPNVAGFVLESLNGTSKWLTMCCEDKEEMNKAQESMASNSNGT